MADIPDFDSLPSVKDMPEGCAWGVFDKDGKKDHFGTINLLTPEVIKAAYSEAKDGITVSLNWPIGAINTPGFQRKGLVHKVLSFKEGPFDLHGFDDEVEFNTQCSSQWDSLVHFHHQPSGTGYNGCKPTVAALEQGFGKEDTSGDLPTLHHWHTRGGLVGRGVLLDYRAWKESKGESYDCFDDTTITTSDLEAIAKHQGTEFKKGDICIVRSGFTEDLGVKDSKKQEEMLGSHKCIGVEGNKESAKWFWNKHFSAVAGDAIAFEVLPPKKEDGSSAGIDGLVLHQYFLGLFGMNIGELWDLKALGEQCKKSGRYSFLLTSVPLNVPGAVGSPPNALALF